MIEGFMVPPREAQVEGTLAHRPRGDGGPQRRNMDIFNASAALTTEALSCFTRAPRKVVLEPGGQLYRFGTIVSHAFKGNEIFSSPWWIPAETYRQITQTAHRTKRPIATVRATRCWRWPSI